MKNRAFLKSAYFKETTNNMVCVEPSIQQQWFLLHWLWFLFRKEFCNSRNLFSKQENRTETEMHFHPTASLQWSSILSYRYRKYDTFSSKYRIGIVSVSKFSTWKVSVSVSVSKFQTLKYQYQYQYHLSPKQVSNSVSLLN